MKTAAHPNSIAAYRDADGVLSDRAKMVVSVLRRLSAATDKQVAKALGFPHKSAVQPRISELVADGVLEECDTERDPDTGKSVRVVRVVAREVQMVWC